MCDPNGRYIVVTGHIYSHHVTLVNVYGPNSDDPDFFRKIFNLLPSLLDHMQTDSSVPEPGFIFHTYFTPTHFLHRVHTNPVNPIDSAVVHPPRLLVALWCYRQLKKTEKKTGACYQNNT